MKRTSAQAQAALANMSGLSDNAKQQMKWYLDGQNTKTTQRVQQRTAQTAANNTLRGRELEGALADILARSDELNEQMQTRTISVADARKAFADLQRQLTRLSGTDGQGGLIAELAHADERNAAEHEDPVGHDDRMRAKYPSLLHEYPF